MCIPISLGEKKDGIAVAARVACAQYDQTKRKMTGKQTTSEIDHYLSDCAIDSLLVHMEACEKHGCVHWI